MLTCAYAFFMQIPGIGSCAVLHGARAVQDHRSDLFADDSHDGATASASLRDAEADGCAGPGGSKGSLLFIYEYYCILLVILLFLFYYCSTDVYSTL